MRSNVGRVGGRCDKTSKNTGSSRVVLVLLLVRRATTRGWARPGL